MLTEEQIKTLLSELELDSSYSFSTEQRFRFNVHFQRGNVEATFRRILTEHQSIAKLGLPPIIEKFALADSGLVIITGKTNNGKSTTASAMINLINETKDAVIVTVEDPIEYIHKNKKSVVKQREVGLDTKSFATAAKHALRQDLDVILIGEILDPETMLVALKAAEVGYLVIATFPAHDTVQAVERMVFSVPPHLQYQVRIQLSNTLLGIIAQRLYPAFNDPRKLVVATEVLVNNSAVSNAIREVNLSGMRTALQTGAASQMHTMKSSLENLCAKQVVSPSYLDELLLEERGIAAL